MAFTSEQLSHGWSLRQADSSEAGAIDNITIPSEVHVDLQRAGRIPDPFKDFNELAVRWVGDCDWIYERTFALPAIAAAGNSVTTDIVFHGLDTFAIVRINGEEILKTDNQFVSHRVNIDKFRPRSTDPETQLHIEIAFRSARKRGLELVKEHPEHRFIVHQTEISRGPVRKAQYHWGWDWGPILTTCGIWKSVVLETYTARIDNVHCEYEVNHDLRAVRIQVNVATTVHANARIAYELYAPDGMLVSQGEKLALPVGSATFADELSYPRLWWPNGYGQQCRYSLTVKLISATDDEVLHQQTKLIGFRRAELIKENDADGTSFYFRINNVDVFSGGSCWIPASSFLTTVDSESYHAWVKLAKGGNQNMLRVWGGGIYEADAFYDACDEHGIMVWQDFMFACASYPTFPAFLKSVQVEAEQNVTRLRHHPSIVLWCGNNEDYQLVERYNLEYPFDEDKDPQSWLKSTFPARYIYEHLLPNVVSSLAPSVPYHPSSPWGNGRSTTLKVDPTVGDIHQWNVWHGEMKPYQSLPEMGGRFVSEFGMEAYPHLETLQKNISDRRQLVPGSRVMDFRNKAIGHQRRMINYMNENFQLHGTSHTMKSHTHISQVMQADAMTWAYKHWRKQWGEEKKRKCGGVLVWQLNDCWPTTSWAIVDYYRIPKVAWYAMRSALAPTVVCVSRSVQDWTMRPADDLWQRDTSHIDPREENPTFDIWIAHSGRLSMKLKVTVRFISIATGAELEDSRREFPVSAAPSCTTIVAEKAPLPMSQVKQENSPMTSHELDPVVVVATLHHGQEQIARDVAWPEPLKYLDFSDRGISVKSAEVDSVVTVTAQKPVKCFAFSEKQGWVYSDNGFDIMPGEVKNVTITNIYDADIQLEDYEYVGR